MKNPTISVFTEYLKTLAEQGFIDVEPTERGWDLTKIYDFLVTSGIAIVPQQQQPKYWLQLLNEDACVMLAEVLEKMKETT